MNIERDHRAAFKAAEDGLREAGLDATFILRSIGVADDRVHLIAGLYDKNSHSRTEVIVEWTPDLALLRERFRLAMTP
jgi:hypothetical protein